MKTGVLAWWVGSKREDLGGAVQAEENWAVGAGGRCSESPHLLWGGILGVFCSVITPLALCPLGKLCEGGAEPSPA